jgi:flagellar motility protein MotE (MotC chaperone)
MTFSEFVEALRQKQLRDEREGLLDTSPQTESQLDKLVDSYKEEMKEPLDS